MTIKPQEIKNRVRQKMMFENEDKVAVKMIPVKSIDFENRTLNCFYYNLHTDGTFYNNGSKILQTDGSAPTFIIYKFETIGDKNTNMKSTLLTFDCSSQKLIEIESVYKNVDTYPSVVIRQKIEKDDCPELHEDDIIFILFPNSTTVPVVMVVKESIFNLDDFSLLDCMDKSWPDGWSNQQYKVSGDKNNLDIKSNLMSYTEKAEAVKVASSVMKETKEYAESGELIRYSNPVTGITMKLDPETSKGEVKYKGTTIIRYDHKNRTLTEMVEDISYSDPNIPDSIIKKYKDCNLYLITVPMSIQDQDKNSASSMLMDGDKMIFKRNLKFNDNGYHTYYEDISGIKEEIIVYRNDIGDDDSPIYSVICNNIDFNYSKIAYKNKEDIVHVLSDYLFPTDNLYTRSAFGIPEIPVEDLR